MHRIRLDAAWEWQDAGQDTGPGQDSGSQEAGDSPRRHRIRFPADVSVQPATRCLQRLFHPPTGLAAGARLRLCFASLPAGTTVTLNGDALAVTAQAGSATYELAWNQLPQDNRISLYFPTKIGSETSLAVGSVWLEIDSP